MNEARDDFISLRQMHTVLVLHFLEGRKQAEIAEALNLSTSKVNRLIALGRRSGMVKIKIETPFQRLMDLEARLTEQVQLKYAIISPTVSDSAETTLQQVGMAAATHLLESLRDGDVIGISGGKAVAAVVDALSPDRDFDVTVVPLTGGVQGKFHTDVNHLASRLAERLGGAALQLHAPLFADKADQRDMLMNVAPVRDVLEVARRATVAVVGIGSIVTPGSSYYDLHPLSQVDRAMLIASGVVGEFLGHLIHDRGRVANYALNQRLVALRPDELAGCARVIGVATGALKVGPIRAVLNGGYVNTLVTDEQTAEALLDPAIKGTS